MLHIEFLLEELSAEKLLTKLLPSVLPDNFSWGFRLFQGKGDLLKQLPSRLQAYSQWMPEHFCIVVLVDEDREDCRALKNQLEAAAKQAGFKTRATATQRGSFKIINRIAVEEIEAWLLGDAQALRAAYSRLPAHFERQARYRSPDAVTGGTAEALEALLQKAGYCTWGMPKTEVAEKVAAHMNPRDNTSPSFKTFFEALITLT
jgi:hypothetical protein